MSYKIVTVVVDVLSSPAPSKLVGGASGFHSSKLVQKGPSLRLSSLEIFLFLFASSLTLLSYP